MTTLLRININPSRKDWVKLLAVVGLAAWLALHLVTLDRYPYISCDEGFYSQIAYNFLQKGNFGTSSALGVAGSDRNVVWPGRLYEVSIAVSQLLFGPTPPAARMVSLAAGLATAYILYRLGKSMYSARVGLAAAIIFQVTWTTLVVMHSGRPETLMAAGTIAVAWLVWRAFERPSFVRGFLAGVGAMLLADIHPNGFHFAFAAGVIVVLHFGYVRNLRMIGAFATGGIVGLAYWLAAHFLPDVSGAIDQFFNLYTNWGFTPWAETHREGIFVFYWQQFVSRHNYLHALSGVYFAGGLLFVALDKARASRFLVGYFALANLAFAFVPHKEWFYAVIWIPLLSLMVAVALERLSHRLAEIGPLSRFTAHRLWLAMLLPLVLTFLAGDLFILYKFRERTYVSYLEQLRELIPPGSTMMATNTWWYAQPDEKFITTNETVMWLEAQTGRPMTQSMFKSFVNQVVPTYFVMDPNWGCRAQPSATYVDLSPVIYEHCAYVGRAEATGYLPSEVFYCSEFIE